MEDDPEGEQRGDEPAPACADDDDDDGITTADGKATGVLQLLKERKRGSALDPDIEEDGEEDEEEDRRERRRREKKREEEEDQDVSCLCIVLMSEVAFMSERLF
jgi:hypothetical protein